MFLQSKGGSARFADSSEESSAGVICKRECKRQRPGCTERVSSRTCGLSLQGSRSGGVCERQWASWPIKRPWVRNQRNPAASFSKNPAAQTAYGCGRGGNSKVASSRTQLNGRRRAVQSRGQCQRTRKRTRLGFLGTFALNGCSDSPDVSPPWSQLQRHSKHGVKGERVDAGAPRRMRPHRAAHERLGSTSVTHGRGQDRRQDRHKISPTSGRTGGLDLHVTLRRECRRGMGPGVARQAEEWKRRNHGRFHGRRRRKEKRVARSSAAWLAWCHVAALEGREKHDGQ